MATENWWDTHDATYAARQAAGHPFVAGAAHMKEGFPPINEFHLHPVNDSSGDHRPQELQP